MSNMAGFTNKWKHLITRFVTRKKLKTLLLCLLVFAIIIHLNVRRNRKVKNDLPPRFDSRRFNFSLMLPYVEPKLPLENRELVLVVLVNSAAKGSKHRLLRQSIRITWGDNSREQKKSWRLYFVLGVSESEQEHQDNLKEASRYNDILLGNFTDHYYSIATKTFMSHYWAVVKLKCQYVLKTDDDVYVRVPWTISWLREQGNPSPFYGGNIKDKYLRVSRENTSKWYLTKDQYARDSWPPYCHGAFHIISADIIPSLVNFTHYKTPYFADDAYIGDILRHELNLVPKQIPGYGFEEPGLTQCQLISHTAIGHRIDSQTMMKYHNFYQNHRQEEPLKWKCSFWIYKTFFRSLQ